MDVQKTSYPTANKCRTWFTDYNRELYCDHCRKNSPCEVAGQPDSYWLSIIQGFVLCFTKDFSVFTLQSDHKCRGLWLVPPPFPKATHHMAFKKHVEQMRGTSNAGNYMPPNLTKKGYDNWKNTMLHILHPDGTQTPFKSTLHLWKHNHEGAVRVDNQPLTHTTPPAATNTTAYKTLQTLMVCQY